MTSNRYESQRGWFLVPWMLGFGSLILLPTVVSVLLSCTRGGEHLASDKLVWVGGANYQRALGFDFDSRIKPSDPWYLQALGVEPNDARVYQSLYNSLWFAVVAVPLGLAAALITALFLNHDQPGMGVVRAVLYLPHLLGGVATLLIWSWLLNPRFGWINEALRAGYAVLDPLVRQFRDEGTHDWPVPSWLYSPFWCKPALVLIHVWTVGGSMLVFLAARRRVPRGLYDAARLDGANRWHCFRHVTWPRISPVVLFNAVIGVVFAMQSFNESYVLSNRQQRDGLLFLAVYIYQVAFEPPYRMGYACALSLILFCVVILLVLLLLVTSRWWVHYPARYG